jgi:hypothetical protein
MYRWVGVVKYLGMTGGAVIVTGIRKGRVDTDSARVDRSARARKAKVLVNPSDLLLAEKPILRALRRIRSKGRTERVFG